MTNVITLGGQPVKPIEPNQGLISAFRALLDSAEKGELQSFVGTGFRRDGSRAVLWSDTPGDVVQVLGSLAWLQADYIKRVGERNA